MEIWKSISGYEGLYEVSNFGNVRGVERQVAFRNSFTTKRAKVKAQRKSRSYLITGLCKDSVTSTFLVHRLVAKAFIENPDNKGTVNHKDCNPHNNHVDNLEWTTQKENIDHSVSLNRHCHGETHGCSKLTEEDIGRIRSLPKGGAKYAEEFGISYSNFKRIRSRKLWRHVA